MRCADLDELVEAVVAGDPLPAEATAHLAGCASCQARVELARAVERLLRSREMPDAARAVHAGGDPPGQPRAVARRAIRGRRLQPGPRRWACSSSSAARGTALVARVVVDRCRRAQDGHRDIAPWTARLLSEAQTLVACRAAALVGARALVVGGRRRRAVVVITKLWRRRAAASQGRALGQHRPLRHTARARGDGLGLTRHRRPGDSRWRPDTRPPFHARNRRS